jgi:hypothetical protein
MSKIEPIGDEDGLIYPLMDAGQRIDWANEDGKAFDALSRWFNKTHAYSLLVYRNGDRWEVRWQTNIAPEVEAEKFAELARLLGSFLDHSRAALNYCIYQLALYAIGQEPSLRDKINPESVEFPIFNDPEAFRQKNKVKKLPEEYRLAIEAVQPYEGRYPGLWILHELAREYRHRVVHPAAILPAKGVAHVLINGQIVLVPDLEVVAPKRPKHGDVVMRFGLANVELDADVKPKLSTAVAIDHPLTADVIGVAVLNQIREDTEAAIKSVMSLFR